MPMHQILPLTQEGQLRLLTAGGLRRSPVTPDTPSLAEASGLNDVDVDMWYGVYAPAGTPADVVANINRDMIEVLERPDVRSVLEKQGLTATTSSPAEFAELTRRDSARWQSVIKSANVRAE
jgi:tripartite-type tricarboxylate transporter receptor subunit TctC